MGNNNNNNRAARTKRETMGHQSKQAGWLLTEWGSLCDRGNKPDAS